MKRNTRTSKQILVHAIGLIFAIAAARTVPPFLCQLGAEKWMDGDLVSQMQLSRGVARIVLDESFSTSDFNTGHDQFDGEWLFGSYLMAGIGFSQMAIEHPDVSEEQCELAEQCIDRLLTPGVRSFDKARWGEDPIDGIGGENHHLAYLGYLNLLLSLHRLASGQDIHAELNDRITAAFIRHVNHSEIVLLESYPGEVYPVDNCFLIGSIGLHQQITGEDHSAVIQRWVARTRSSYVDSETGLLIQAVKQQHGLPIDEPRGSGTALGAFALHYADPDLAKDLYLGIKSSLADICLGFGVVREYPKGAEGHGDIDSGPIVFGYGLSATGFTIGCARRFGDDEFFGQLLAVANLYGVPRDSRDRREYVSGGPLGNAILLAMLTAPKASMDAPGGAQ